VRKRLEGEGVGVMPSSQGRGRKCDPWCSKASSTSYKSCSNHSCTLCSFVRSIRTHKSQSLRPIHKRARITISITHALPINRQQIDILQLNIRRRIIKQLERNSRRIRHARHRIPAGISDARPVSRVHVIDRARNIRPAKVLDVRCSGIGGVDAGHHAAVCVLVKVDGGGEDGEGGVEDVDVLPVDVGDVAEGVEGGLEAGGVEGVAGGYVAGRVVSKGG